MYLMLITESNDKPSRKQGTKAAQQMSRFKPTNHAPGPTYGRPILRIEVSPWLHDPTQHCPNRPSTNRGVHSSHRTLFVVLGSYGNRFGGGGGRNSTLSVRCDVVGLPPDCAGSNCHNPSACSASRCRARGPDNTFAAATFPLSSIVTSMVTTPSSSRSFAQGGKVGRGCDRILAGTISTAPAPPCFRPLDGASSVPALASLRFGAIRASAGARGAGAAFPAGATIGCGAFVVAVAVGGIAAANAGDAAGVTGFVAGAAVGFGGAVADATGGSLG
jgi:hypothetical protein